MAAQCMHQASAQQLSCRSQSASFFRGSTAPLRQQRQRGRLQRRLSARAEVDVSQQEGAVEKTGPNFKPVKDVQEIMDILPHRYFSVLYLRTLLSHTLQNTTSCSVMCRFPFLLVDRVIELEHQKYAVGYKNVTVNDNFFPGHFPQRAIMPGKLY